MELARRPERDWQPNGLAHDGLSVRRDRLEPKLACYGERGFSEARICWRFPDHLAGVWAALRVENTANYHAPRTAPAFGSHRLCHCGRARSCQPFRNVRRAERWASLNRGERPPCCSVSRLCMAEYRQCSRKNRCENDLAGPHIRILKLLNGQARRLDVCFPPILDTSAIRATIATMDQLTDHERRACMALIEAQAVESRAPLIDELNVARVEALNADRSILRFHLPHYERDEGQQPLSAEGTVVDAD